MTMDDQRQGARWHVALLEMLNGMWLNMPLSLLLHWSAVLRLFSLYTGVGAIGRRPCKAVETWEMEVHEQRSVYALA